MGRGKGRWGAIGLEEIASDKKRKSQKRREEIFGAFSSQLTEAPSVNEAHREYFCHSREAERKNSTRTQQVFSFQRSRQVNETKTEERKNRKRKRRKERKKEEEAEKKKQSKKETEKEKGEEEARRNVWQ